MTRELWAGVDVGGVRKGFHVAVVDAVGLVADPCTLATPGEVAGWLAGLRPLLVGVDSPAAPAPAGERSRPDERAFARAGICSIRWTPDLAGLEPDRSPRADYYAWIRHGLELHAALAAAGLAGVECFPTASWTCWGGPRGARGRGAWSEEVLRSLPLEGVPPRLNQDERDAIGAALTARAHTAGLTRTFGAIVVPRRPGAASAASGAAVAAPSGAVPGGSGNGLVKSP